MITNSQKQFNEIIGRIYEIIHSEKFTTLVLHCGKTNPRTVALSCKNEMFIDLCSKTPIGVNQLVKLKFYISSREANGRYYTNAHFIEIEELT